MDTQLGGPSSSKKDQLVGVSSFLVSGRVNEAIGQISGILDIRKTRGLLSWIGLSGREQFSGEHDPHKLEIVLLILR